MNTPFFLGLAGNIVIALSIISLVFLADILRRRTMKHLDNLVAFSVGLIIAIVFLGFIPEVTSHGNISGSYLGMLLLSWIFLFYIFELFLHWHHCKDVGEHHHDHHTHEHTNNMLMFSGTFLHNALHGIVLYSAFSIDVHFGIATTLAILLHAIPQNIANLLMNHKDTRFAYIAAFGWVFWALSTLIFWNYILEYQFEILTIIGGGLLYMAMSDILPSVKEKWGTQHKIVYLICMLIWVGLFILSQNIIWTEHSHEYIEHHYDEHEEHLHE